MHTKFNLTMKRLMLLSVIVLSIMSSCNRPELGISDRGNIILVADKHDFSSPVSKTLIGSSSSSDDVVMYWEPGEIVGAYSSTDGFTAFSGTNTAEAATATFVSSEATVVPEVVFYPSVEGADDPSAVPVSVPADQEYADRGSIGQYDYKYTKEFQLQDDGSYRMSFKQMCALIKLVINLDGLCEFKENEILYGIEIVSENALVGEGLIDITASVPTWTNVTEVSSLWLDISSNNILGSSQLVAYGVVLPGAHKDTEWSICISTVDKTTLDDEENGPAVIREICFFSKAKCDLEAGQYYTLPLNVSIINAGYHYDDDGVLVSGPSINVYESGEEEGGEDVPVVPSGETANCYMISAPGTYSFDASVMGNGDAGIIADAGFHTVSAQIVGGTSAELLWQDVAGFISSVSYDPSSKVISYVAESNVGNACIAVKNAEGTILWSWHIWGTGEDPVGDDLCTNRAGALFNVMDRYLGQLKQVRSNTFPSDGSMYVREDNTLVSAIADALQPTYLCTCYQWGRKDPIPTSSTYYYIDGAVKGEISSYPVHTAGSSAEASIQFSIENPDKMLYASSMNSSDWLAELNQYLWGDNNSSTLYDWYSDGKLSNAGAGSGWTDGKTIYDPCPAGYRVANKWTFTGFVKADGGSGKFSSADTTPEAITDNIRCLTTTYLHGETLRYLPIFCNGYFFMSNDSDTDGAYYPMSGYRSGVNGALTQSGTEGYVWTSSRNSSSETQSTSSILKVGAYNWYFDATDLSGMHAGPNGTVNVVDFTNRLNALPVRCVRE